MVDSAVISVFLHLEQLILVSFAISQGKQVCSQGSNFEKQLPVGVVRYFFEKSNMEIVRGESWSSFVYLSFIFDR